MLAKEIWAELQHAQIFLEIVYTVSFCSTQLEIGSRKDQEDDKDARQIDLEPLGNFNV